MKVETFQASALKDLNRDMNTFFTNNPNIKIESFQHTTVWCDHYTIYTYTAILIYSEQLPEPTQINS